VEVLLTQLVADADQGRQAERDRERVPAALLVDGIGDSDERLSG
jgi:hypothetical protein